MKATKKYLWKELTKDGLLKEPEVKTPHNFTVNLNNLGGYRSEEESVKAMSEFQKAFSNYLCAEYVLVTVYEFREFSE